MGRVPSVEDGALHRTHPHDHAGRSEQDSEETDPNEEVEVMLDPCEVGVCSASSAGSCCVLAHLA